MTINQAVRRAFKNVKLNSKSAKIAYALKLLSVPNKTAYNHSLTYFDAASVTEGVWAYFNKYRDLG